MRSSPERPGYEFESRAQHSDTEKTGCFKRPVFYFYRLWGFGEPQDRQQHLSGRGGLGGGYVSQGSR